MLRYMRAHDAFVAYMEERCTQKRSRDVVQGNPVSGVRMIKVVPFSAPRGNNENSGSMAERGLEKSINIRTRQRCVDHVYDGRTIEKRLLSGGLYVVCNVSS